MSCSPVNIVLPRISISGWIYHFNFLVVQINRTAYIIYCTGYLKQKLLFNIITTIINNYLSISFLVSAVIYSRFVLLLDICDALSSVATAISTVIIVAAAATVRKPSTAGVIIATPAASEYSIMLSGTAH